MNYNDQRSINEFRTITENKWLTLSDDRLKGTLYHESGELLRHTFFLSDQLIMHEITAKDIISLFSSIGGFLNIIILAFGILA